MGGERLIVYLRPRHFPTDFCRVSNGPGRGKLPCVLARKYCSGQFFSCCGSCLLLHQDARAVSGQAPSESGEERQLLMPAPFLTAGPPRWRVTPVAEQRLHWRIRDFPGSRALPAGHAGASGEGSGPRLLVGWLVGKQMSRWRHCHLLLLDTTLPQQGRAGLRHRNTFTITWEIGIMINLIEVGGVSVPSTPSRGMRRKSGWLEGPI